MRRWRWWGIPQKFKFLFTTTKFILGFGIIKPQKEEGNLTKDFVCVGVIMIWTGFILGSRLEKRNYQCNFCFRTWFR